VRGAFTGAEEHTPSGARPFAEKNACSCWMIAAWSSFRAGFRRYSLSSILQCSIHIFQASWETFS